MELNKQLRLLRLYTRLQKGEILNKRNIATEYEVNERSVQRDIEDLRAYLAEYESTHELIYDNKLKGYRLTERTSPL